MARYAVVRSGNVENVVEWDGASDWKPPAGATAVLDSNAQAEIGGSWDGATFTRPPAPVVVAIPDPDVELDGAIAAVDTTGIVDPTAKKALDDLKAALRGQKAQGAVKARPV